MKKMIVSVLASVLISHGIAKADDFPVIKTSPEFNKLKNLVGDWKGELKRSTGEVVTLELNYKVISNGSVIVESAVEDGIEMITTYRDRFGKLTATHYCALGNQPTFNLASATESTLDFDFDPRCGLEEGKHKYVKDWRIIHDPKKVNELVTEYEVINKDKSIETSAAKLTKVK